jgi:hypothetical protein
MRSALNGCMTVVSYKVYQPGGSLAALRGGPGGPLVRGLHSAVPGDRRVSAGYHEMTAWAFRDLTKAMADEPEQGNVCCRTP